MSEASYSGYAVLIRRKDGSSFLASGNECVTAVFRDWWRASRYRGELKTHGLHTGKIVRVSVHITTHGQGN